MLDATVLYPPNIQSHPGQAMPIVKFTQDNMTMTRSMQEMGSVDGHVREPKAFMPQSALPSSHKRGPMCTRRLSEKPAATHRTASRTGFQCASAYAR
jgi:hypothetical protein